MMPNVFQYPVAVAAVLRAGFVVVSTNPLYTPREPEPQLGSGAKAIIIFENFASVLRQVIANVPTKHVILTAMGDVWPAQGAVVNYAGAQRQEDGAGLLRSPGPCASTTRCRADAAAELSAPRLSAGRCRGAAVHRWHHWRV